ncbi:MAG: F0F1 ATP synthase subunit delta [Candidatus Saccharimonadales bacterium]
MKLDLQDNLSSTQDLKSAILEVRKYAQWFSQNSIKTYITNDKPKDTPVISEVATNLIQKWAAEKPLNQKRLDELLATLQDLESSLPHITITLAAVPTTSLKKILVAWCREHISTNILVDFRFNSTLLGGMVIGYGSHVYDWSFRRQILAECGRFPEILRHV